MLNRRLMIIPLWRLEAILKKLSHLLASGLPLLMALDLLINNCRRQEQSFLTQLKNKLEQGLPLSEVWKQITREEISATLIYAAEQSGLLSEMLAHLYQFAQQQNQMRRFIKQSLRYPLFLLLLMFFMLIAMCGFIIPQFAQLYSSLNVKLPWFSLRLIQLSEFSSRYSHQVAVLTAVIIFLVWLSYQYCPGKMHYFLNIFLPFKKRWQIWQFWHAMAHLLCSGVPLTQACKMSYPLLPQGQQQKLFLYCINQIQHGQKPSEVFKQVKLFNKELQQLFMMGEMTGQLDDLLANYVKQEQQALQEQFEQFKTWFEPIVMCVIGSMLAVVLLSLYLPMVQLGKYI